MIFTASEIRENLLRQYRSLKKQYEKAMDNRNTLMLSQVSPINALNHAKNIFVYGGFDKLHAKLEEYEETMKQFEHDSSQYLLWQKSFNDKTLTVNAFTIPCRAEKIYRHRVILLNAAPYSNISAEKMGLSVEEWLKNRIR